MCPLSLLGLLVTIATNGRRRSQALPPHGWVEGEGARLKDPNTRGTVNFKLRPPLASISFPAQFSHQSPVSPAVLSALFRREFPLRRNDVGLNAWLYMGSAHDVDDTQ